MTVGDCLRSTDSDLFRGKRSVCQHAGTQDKQGKWRDVCWPVTADFRKQLNDALIEGYGVAIESLQATLDATKEAADKPSFPGH